MLRVESIWYLYLNTKMATERSQEELKRKANLAMQTSKDPIEILRAKCLARGANGIRGLSRLFKIMDDTKDHRLDFDEFKKGVNEYGLNYSNMEMKELFNAFDEDHSGIKTSHIQTYISYILIWFIIIKFNITKKY